MKQEIEQLKLITAPFAYTSEHVQGPGGNTSYKSDGNLLIKASGFTFKDVDDNVGIVLLNNSQVIETLLAKAKNNDESFANEPPHIISSVPEGLRPSMEFEFHALLAKYVLHTHSVYANVVACSTECASILSGLFKADEYVLVPYVTPGFPIAAYLANNTVLGKVPRIIFLKNHGIIVHGDSYEEVLSNYVRVEDMLKGAIRPKSDAPLPAEIRDADSVVINAEGILLAGINIPTLADDLMNDVLIPDQSIFFRDKVLSLADGSTGIFADIDRNEILITGPQKFIAACLAMIASVYYIKNSIDGAGFHADYIPKNKIDIMHGLATEKYRTALLKNKS